MSEQQAIQKLHLQERLRIASNVQCPECYGVRLTAQGNRHLANPINYICEECGCQFGARLPSFPTRR